MAILNERHFNHILKETTSWYNAERSHSGREHLPPGWDKPPEPNNTAAPSEISCTTRLGAAVKSSQNWLRKRTSLA